MQNKRIWLVLLLLPLLVASQVWAQGIPTGTLNGKVADQDGIGLPGVTVTAKSPALQGTRSAVTSVNGDYVLPNLPPGEYTVTFVMPGFQTVTKAAKVAASQQIPLAAKMSMQAVAAEATVVAQAETISQTNQAATTYTSELTNKLPVARTILSSVVLTPGVNTNGPGGNVTISGAQSFDNVYTVNGAVIQDNVRSTPFNLFIEDAIQETTTSTSSISAEYGRFTGGIINTITKSGGNNFSGSFRVTFNNDDWRAITPAPGDVPVDKVIPAYEATIGGPIWKDRIWFFGAGRMQDQSVGRQTSAPASIPYELGDDEKRFEGKLTITPFQNQTITGSYFQVDREQTNYGFTSYPFYDLASVYNRQLPQDFFVVNYNGVITDKFFLEAQYSQRHFTFENSGSQYTDLIKGTPIWDNSRGGLYNSPYFCGVCDPEKRDNEQILIKGTYFLSTKSLGSHNIVLGYDDFNGKRKSNNYQSGSNLIFDGSGAIFQNGDIFPIVDADSYIEYWPIPQLSQGSEVRTYSVFLNDSWRLNNHLSFNLGVRWDKNNAKDSSGAVTADDSAFSPRLGLSYDIKGDGSLKLNASYAKYVGGIQETQVGAGTSAGNPAVYLWFYQGPEINTGSGPLVTREQALAQIFAWYGITAPNMAPTRPGIEPFYVRVPGVNSVIRESLNSPYSDEFTVGAGGTIGNRMNYRADFVYRKFGDFYSTRVDMGTGTVTDSLGNVFDLQLIQNSNLPERNYRGVNLQASYRPVDPLSVGFIYTWSRTYGNIIGETSGSGAVRSSMEMYPEYIQESWNNPKGLLDSDQTHRMRFFATYDFQLPKAAGNLNMSGIYSWDSGTPYSISGGIDPRRWVTNPGYKQPPTNVTYYFTDRDAYRTSSVNRLDLALNYSYNIGPVEIFLKPEVLNVFNQLTLVAFDQTILTARNSSSLTAFNPFTTDRSALIECPQTATSAECRALGAHWKKGPSWGKARNNADYQLPRTFRVGVGIRF